MCTAVYVNVYVICGCVHGCVCECTGPADRLDAEVLEVLVGVLLRPVHHSVEEVVPDP